MENYFKIFDEINLKSHCTYRFTGKDGDFLIYAFCKNDGDDFICLIDELNSLAKKYSLTNFGVKEAFIMNHLNSIKTYLFLEQIILKMSKSPEFNLCYEFWYESDR